jgi:hypothetical protein
MPFAGVFLPRRPVARVFVTEEPAVAGTTTPSRRDDGRRTRSAEIAGDVPPPQASLHVSIRALTVPLTTSVI